ncbi:hypothetical protein ACLMJK_000770 [Lecanora helva]
MAEPMGPPPAGGDESRIPLIVGFLTATTILSFLCVTTRVFTRVKIQRDPGFDDALIVFAEILQIINYAFIMKSTSYGFGRHVYYLHPLDEHKAVFWNFISNPFAIVTLALPRLAIVMFISRVVGNTRKRQMWILYFLAVSMILFSCLAAIFLFVQCDPPSAAWNRRKPHKCWNPDILANYFTFVGAYSAFIDFVIAAYPVSIIFGLKMALRRKVEISIIMSLGLLACICAIIRTTKEDINYLDITYSAVDIIITTTAEINTLQICACIPTFLPLINKLRGHDPWTSASHKRSPFQASHSGKTPNHKPSGSWRPLPPGAGSGKGGVGDDMDGEDVLLGRLGGSGTKVEGGGGGGDGMGVDGGVPRRGIRATTEVQTQWEAV